MDLAGARAGHADQHRQPDRHVEQVEAMNQRELLELTMKAAFEERFGSSKVRRRRQFALCLGTLLELVAMGFAWRLGGWDAVALVFCAVIANDCRYYRQSTSSDARGKP
jgi:hypothetical protein